MHDLGYSLLIKGRDQQPQGHAGSTVANSIATWFHKFLPHSRNVGWQEQSQLSMTVNTCDPVLWLFCYSLRN